MRVLVVPRLVRVLAWVGGRSCGAVDVGNSIRRAHHRWMVQEGNISVRRPFIWEVV